MMCCRRPSRWRWPTGLLRRPSAGNADEVVRSLCRRAGSAHGRVVLAARTNSDGSTTASADAILVLDEYQLLCAGAAASTMTEAIDALDTAGCNVR